ncbi:MAG TPA: NAD(P)-dependent oxidoreductase [Alphaproteobacteria bacterium]|nr:NAD(P)-dependent oxidoreductase [Alphaproteobacteria bacterium]
MFPILLDLARARVVVIGDGEAAVRRLAQLDADGSGDLRVFSAAPSAALELAAGARLVRREPTMTDLAGTTIVFICDLGVTSSADIAGLAGRAGALVHVEDQPRLCTIQMPAVVRRGDLTIAVSTNGVSPALSRRLREHIAALFGPEWAGRVALLGALRRSWRRAKVPAAEIARRTVAAVESRGWLAGVGSGRDADRRRA